MSSQQAVEQENVEDTSIEVDEEAFREMLEAEEQLLEERRSTSDDSEETERLSFDVFEEVESLEPVSATIRSVVREKGTVRVEFFPGSQPETETDSLPWPSDPHDDDEPLNRLFDLCGVERGHLTELQGKTVPVKQTRGRFELHLPETTTLPALLLYRTWWWYRRRRLFRAVAGKSEVKTGLKVAGAGAALGIGNYFLILFAMYAGDGPADYFAHHFPALAASFPDLIVGLIGMIVVLIGWATAFADVAVGIWLSTWAANDGLAWVEKNIWPF